MKKMILTVFALSLCPLAYAKRPIPRNKAFESNTTSQRSSSDKLQTLAVKEVGTCKAECLANVARYLSQETIRELNNLKLKTEGKDAKVIAAVFAKIPALATKISDAGISGPELYAAAVGNAAVQSPRWVDAVAQGNIVKTINRLTQDGALQKQRNLDKLEEVKRRCKSKKI